METCTELFLIKKSYSNKKKIEHNNLKNPAKLYSILYHLFSFFSNYDKKTTLINLFKIKNL